MGEGGIRWHPPIDKQRVSSSLARAFVATWLLIAATVTAGQLDFQSKSTVSKLADGGAVNFVARFLCSFPNSSSGCLIVVLAIRYSHGCNMTDLTMCDL